VSNKIREAVDRLELDLKGKVVLTEAATGAYVVTPVLAALAGADVYAYTKQTRYGTVEDVRKVTQDLMLQLGVDKNKVQIIDNLSPEIISNADIITNSGHLRPLDENKLKHVKQGAVIPLMYEDWEWRDADLNLDYCKKNNIRIGATNERHPDVDVFNYLGDMAMKMIFDAGLCPYRNYFTLITNNDFGPFIAKVLSKNCAGLAVCDLQENKEGYKDIDIEWIGNFPDFNVPEKFRNSEAIIFTAYPFDKIWIAEQDAPITIDKIKKEFADPVLLRYCGDVEENISDIKLYPKHVHSGHMGILPSAIGFDPIIRLQSGGLKAGQLLLENKTSYKGIELVKIL
jgi:hypothetical protein